MTTVPAGRIWWRGLLGIAWLAVAAWLWATRAEVLLAGHPAFAITAALVALVGVMLLVLALLAWGRRRAQLPAPKRALWLVVLGRAVALVLSVGVLGSLVYLRPFGATGAAIDLMEGSSGVTVTDSATEITLTPAQEPAEAGLIFQPGARVDSRAYLPLLEQVAADGYLVVIIKQPFGIAFTAVGAPSGINAEHPEVTHWAVGGHSLGGVAASSYAGDHPAQVSGLLLWASYPLHSLAARSDLLVTSVSGTEDGLATPSDIDDSRSDLPGDTTYVAVEGAVHAFFGDYGSQPGDGQPTVDRATAQTEIVAVSVALLAAVAAG